MLLPVGIYLGLNALNYGVAYGCHLFTKARLKKDGYEYRKMNTPLKDKLARVGSRAALLSMPVLHIITPLLVPICDYLSYKEYKEFLIEERLVKKIKGDSSDGVGTLNIDAPEKERQTEKLLFVDKVNNVAYVEEQAKGNSNQAPRVLRKAFRPRFMDGKAKRTNE